MSHAKAWHCLCEGSRTSADPIPSREMERTRTSARVELLKRVILDGVEF